MVAPSVPLMLMAGMVGVVSASSSECAVKLPRPGVVVVDHDGIGAGRCAFVTFSWKSQPADA